MTMYEACCTGKVVVWGTGCMSKEYNQILDKCGFEVFAFVDNNTEKWGTQLFGVNIISPNELYEVHKNEKVVLIIATVFYKEILEQISGFDLYKVYGLKELIKLKRCVCVAEENNLSLELVMKVADSSQKIQEIIEVEGERAISQKTYIHENPRAQFIDEYLEEEIPELRRKYRLSMCAIIKNEGDCLLEWIEYHRMIGVEHFYIYDNESSDGMYDRIKGYIDMGVVTYTMWPGKLQQFNVYNDAIKNYKYETKYMAFFDGDEFLVPMGEKKVYETINEIFLEIPDVGGIGINWRNFGSSFFEDAPEGLLFENYKYRAEEFDKINAVIKTICNPRRVEGYKHPHFPIYKEKYMGVSENGSAIPGAFFYDGMCRKLRLHHYRKNMGEFRRRLLAGKPDINRELSQEYLIAVEKQMQSWNAVYDPIMDKYIETLRKRLEEYKQI